MKSFNVAQIKLCLESNVSARFTFNCIQFRKSSCKVNWHKGSIRASHPAAPGFESWLCQNIFFSILLISWTAVRDWTHLVLLRGISQMQSAVTAWAEFYKKVYQLSKQETNIPLAAFSIVCLFTLLYFYLSTKQRMTFLGGEKFFYFVFSLSFSRFIVCQDIITIHVRNDTTQMTKILQEW